MPALKVCPTVETCPAKKRKSRIYSLSFPSVTGGVIVEEQEPSIVAVGLSRCMYRESGRAVMRNEVSNANQEQVTPRPDATSTGKSTKCGMRSVKASPRKCDGRSSG